MRPVLHGDLHAAARCLAVLPPGERAGEIARLIERSHIADCYRKRFGRAHPEFGNGSLMCAVGPVVGPDCANDFHYLVALVCVAEAILNWRREQAERGQGRRERGDFLSVGRSYLLYGG